MRLQPQGQVAGVRVEMNYRERPGHREISAALDALK
jgi:hypothetical protein